jgi:hypothetical protein
MRAPRRSTVAPRHRYGDRTAKALKAAYFTGFVEAVDTTGICVHIPVTAKARTRPARLCNMKYRKQPLKWNEMVGDNGFEPLTSSM